MKKKTKNIHRYTVAKDISDLDIMLAKIKRKEVMELRMNSISMMTNPNHVKNQMEKKLFQLMKQYVESKPYPK